MGKSEEMTAVRASLQKKRKRFKLLAARRESTCTLSSSVGDVLTSEGLRRAVRALRHAPITPMDYGPGATVQWTRIPEAIRRRESRSADGATTVIEECPVSCEGCGCREGFPSCNHCTNHVRRINDRDVISADRVIPDYRYYTLAPRAYGVTVDASDSSELEGNDGS